MGDLDIEVIPPRAACDCDDADPALVTTCLIFGVARAFSIAFGTAFGTAFDRTFDTAFGTLARKRLQVQCPSAAVGKHGPSQETSARTAWKRGGDIEAETLR